MGNDLCKLCGNSEQVDSHILPKFIFRWLKKTGTGRLRSTENVNLPKEDGIVKKFLCEACESKFNKAETYFAKNVFYPVINDKIEEFKYDENLRYFIISLFWRTLKDSLYEDVEGTQWHDKLLEIERVWTDYLYHDKPMTNFNEIHCIAGVDIIGDKSPDDFVMYMSRMTDAGIPNNDNWCFFYVKIPRFIFLMPISGFNLELFENSKIEISGTYNLNNVTIREPIIGYHLYERAKSFDQKKRGMSYRQKQSMKKLTKQQEKNWKNNDLGRINRYLNNE